MTAQAILGGAGFIQVGDILHVDDLVDAFTRVLERIDRAEVAGQAFNLGGGPRNAVSLREVIALIGALRAEPVPIAFEGWRASDQRYYVSNTAKLEAATGWRARVPASEGIRLLHDWLWQERGGPAVAAADLRPAMTEVAP